MLYLVSYDIPSTPDGDRRRSRIARRLEGLGLRVQYSVFEMEVSPEKISAILSSLESLMDPLQDSLRVYPLCAACRNRVVRVGVGAICEHQDVLVW